MTISVATPSPPRNLHSPPTPKHGYADSWEPYSPRKSARLSQRASTARTPSPKSISRQTSNPQTQPPHNQPSHLRSPRSARRDPMDSTLSPAPTPIKRKMNSVDRPRFGANPLGADNASATPARGASTKSSLQAARNVMGPPGMLPTPDKTPARRDPSAVNEANIAAIARTLFTTNTTADAAEQVAPAAAKKKRPPKKYTGISLDSFTAVEEEAEIEIYTDSHERIPEVDNNADNPFYGDAVVAPEPIKRSSKRKLVTIPGEGSQTVEAATRREDGLVYVFRGKKIFRKFEDLDNTMSIDGEDAEDEVSTKRITRSSIKPRLLFPAHQKRIAAVEEEEAVTDIEDEEAETEEEDPHTPSERVGQNPETPDTPKFAPDTPAIAGGRTTRSGLKAGKDTTTPGSGSRSKSGSPFGSWRMTKNQPAGSGQKRPAEKSGSMTAAKRARNS